MCTLFDLSDRSLDPSAIAHSHTPTQVMEVMVEYECDTVEEAIEETLDQIQAEAEVPPAIDPRHLCRPRHQRRTMSE